MTEQRPIYLGCGARYLVRSMNDYATNPDEDVTSIYEQALNLSDQNYLTRKFRIVMNAIAADPFPFDEFKCEISNIVSFTDNHFEFVDSIGRNFTFWAHIDANNEVTFSIDFDDGHEIDIPNPDAQKEV